ncbi:MAG TPA: hypothetical protein VLB86_01855 [Gaiellaceae bacterium]|nr:hypothetical protein [Gaiellaceae bacterium]
MAAGTVYGIAWREGEGQTFVGQLELAGDALALRGATTNGGGSVRYVPYAGIAEVRIGRSPRELVNGTRTVVLERRDEEPVFVAALEGFGTAFELADAVAGLVGRAAAVGPRVLVVVPIKPEARERAAALIGAGPPFELEGAELTRHDVFLTDREAVFVFEGEGASALLARLPRTPGAWRAALAWKDVVDGRPRVAEEAYTWAGPPE